MDATTMLERTLAANQALIGGLSADDLNRPSPCWGWNVRELINHMVGVNAHFAEAISGQTSPAVGDASADLLGNDAAGAYARSAQAALDAWRTPGALDKTLPFGPNTAPAALVLSIHQGDQLLHFWDLNKALGRPPEIDDAIVASADQTARAILSPDFRGPGKAFGYEVTCPDPPVTVASGRVGWVRGGRGWAW